MTDPFALLDTRQPTPCSLSAHARAALLSATSAVKGATVDVSVPAAVRELRDQGLITSRFRLTGRGAYPTKPRRGQPMTSTEQRVAKVFALNTADHELTTLHDDGIYRHILMSKPGTGLYRYELITWPGHLAISGDLDSYVFARVDDMFTFFRGQPELLGGESPGRSRAHQALQRGPTTRATQAGAGRIREGLPGSACQARRTEDRVRGRGLHGAVPVRPQRRP